MVEYNSPNLVIVIYVVSAIVLWLIGFFREIPIVRKFFDLCLAECPPKLYEYIKRWRGNNYYLRKEDQANPPEKKCLFTIWALLHMILYVILGFFAPNFFWETFVTGVIFEFIENFAFDCHDALDIIWNTTGFLIGKWLHNQIVT